MVHSQWSTSISNGQLQWSVREGRTATTGIIRRNPVSGAEVRTEVLPKTLKNSHHTIIHAAVYSLNKIIGVFHTPSVTVNDCAIDEHKMVIGLGITYRSPVLTPYETQDIL